MTLSSLQKIVTHVESKNHCLEITEGDSQAVLKKVTIESFQNPSYMFVLDAKPKECYCIADGPQKKVCDAIIATTYDKKDYLIFAELKSEFVNKDDIIVKFKSSECFLDYCYSILKKLYNVNISDINKRFVVFRILKQRVPKTVMRVPVHDSPEQAKYLSCHDSGERFRIRSLVK